MEQIGNGKGLSLQAHGSFQLRSRLYARWRAAQFELGRTMPHRRGNDAQAGKASRAWIGGLVHRTACGTKCRLHYYTHGILYYV